MSEEEYIGLELMLNRFNRLITELLRGTIPRNSFQPWEVSILLDVDTCEIEPRKRVEILRQYQKAVTKQLQSGPGPPMLLSEYLQQRTEYLQQRIMRRPSME